MDVPVLRIAMAMRMIVSGTVGKTPWFQSFEKAEEAEPQAKKPTMMSRPNRDTPSAHERGLGILSRRPIYAQRGAAANRPRAQIDGGQLM